jgi:Zn-dependent protease with chaperone function
MGCEAMGQMDVAAQAGMAAQQPKRCPLCGAAVAPDALGLYACSCGWGGPGDPLEHDRGLAKLLAKTDRSLADGQARRDLRRLAEHGEAASSRNVFYLALLLLVATLIYLGIIAVVALCVWLLVDAVLTFSIIEAIIGFIFLALIALALWPRRGPKSIPATRERFPALWAALDEASQRVGAPLPARVVLTADDDLHIGRRLGGGNTLTIGAATLPLLTEVEAKALLTHELAHASNGGTALHRYCAQAEQLLHELVYGVLEGITGQSYGAMRRTQRYARSGDVMSSVGFMGLIVSWTILLPFRILWSCYHLLRMHESRMAEFSSDRAAIVAYGPQAFINGLTGYVVARRTFVKSGAALGREMRLHNSQNFYAEMRRHYSELPPQVISQLRVEATTGFRTLARSHPIMPDRLRAAYATLAALPPSPAPTAPAYTLLSPASATDANTIETELTTLLFTPKK